MIIRIYGKNDEETTKRIVINSNAIAKIALDKHNDDEYTTRISLINNEEIALEGDFFTSILELFEDEGDDSNAVYWVSPYEGDDRD